MSTVRVIREFPPVQDEECGSITVQAGAPRTPQIMSQIIQKVGDITQLSSPINHYMVTYTRPPSPIIARIRHKVSDRLRLKDAKDNIIRLEERIYAIEKENEDRRRLVLEWETCERLAQGLNDYIKDTVMSEANSEEDLSNAKIIWRSKKNRYRYLPHLFTHWWLVWNANDPDAYPLPNAFATLSESDIADFQERPDLADGISDAAELLWNSSLSPVIELMLILFHNRPKGRNDLQHPTPTADFAHSYVTSLALYSEFSETQKSRAKYFIENGRRRDGTLLFTPSQAFPAPAPAIPAHTYTPAPHATGSTARARGTTRPRDSEDDDDGGPGMALKRQRQGE